MIISAVSCYLIVQVDFSFYLTVNQKSSLIDFVLDIIFLVHIHGNLKIAITFTPEHCLSIGGRGTTFVY